MSDIDKENLKEETQPLTINNQQSDSGHIAVTDDAQKKKKKKIIYIIVGILLLIAVILAIVLPLTLGGGGGGGGNGDNDNPFDNKEFNLYDVDQTTYKSTVWKSEFTIKQSKTSTANVPKPQQYMRLGSSLSGAQYKPVDPSDIVDAPNNNWAENVKFNIDLVDNYQARIYARDETAVESRKTVSENLFKRPVLAWEARLSQFNYTMSNESFYFSFGNIYNGETIISTKNRKLLVSDYYSEMGFVVPTKRCFGLGQRQAQLQLQPGTYTLHQRARDEGLPTDDQLGGKNGNHIHPFILCQTGVEKDFFGMFFVSTAPQVFEVVQFSGYDKMIINYITLGGSIEIYFIVRGKADDIIKKYNAMVGTSQLPPYYALGVYQGSNSYDTQDKIQAVVDGYSNMAFEGVFIDNYNQNPHWTYTVGSNFPDLKTKIATMQTNNQHVILGTSYAISNDDAYAYFKTAILNSCLVDSTIDRYGNKQVIGIIDKTPVEYLDPLHTGMAGFLDAALPQFQTTVGSFDGLNIQDAYMPNHISGEVNQGITKQEESKSHTKRMLKLTEESVGSYSPYLINQTKGEYYSTYYLPFLPNFNYSNYLDNMTISLNASHGGKQNLYNLYVKNGLVQYALQKTFNSLVAKQDTRPLLFTDASWAGSGQYATALITDIYRSWDNLKYLIDQALALSMYSMSNFMVDVCGSLGPLDEELCARWMQVAAFLPMARNYYNSTYKDPTTGQRMTTPGSEAYNFKSLDASVAYAAAVTQRLQYTRYIYTLLYQSNRDGGAVVRPLFFDYPNDDKCFDNVDKTFMLGDALKVSPVLEQGKKDSDTYSVYFPQGVWIDLNDHTNQMVNTSTGGKSVNLNASFAQTNVHLKAGKIIPFQYNGEGNKTTNDLLKQRMGFKVFRDGQYADGYVYIDDGVTYNTSTDPEQYTLWKLRYAENSINFWVEYGNFEYEPANLKIHYLDKIEILNAEDLNETDFACYLGRSLTPVDLQKDWNGSTKILTLKPKTENPGVTFKDIGFIKFGNSKKEPNFCQSTAFTYLGSLNKDAANTDTYYQYILTSSQGGDVLKPLVAEFFLLDNEGTINMEITSKVDFDNKKKTIYRVPTPTVYDTSKFNDKLTKKLSDYVTISADGQPFTYSIHKDGDANNVLWTSDPSHLYFSDYFVMDSGLFKMNPDNNYPLLGMGERAGSIFYRDEDGGIHSRYTFDQANPIDDGLPPGRNFYGYQPFYAFQASTKDWFGVFDVSSYATDYVLYSKLKGQEDTTQIHKIAIGGTILKFFFVGSKIDDVIRKYQKLVGNPTVPPLWAFGWQQCRFGYVTSEDWWEVYENYKTFDLPLDVMWADIDYMDDYKLFTIANQSYHDLPEKVKLIKEDGRHFVPIMDAGVAVRKNQGYRALVTGMEKDVFIQKSDQSGPLTAGVWCGNAYFPDFFNDDTVDWWQDNFDYLRTTLGLDFDGVWLDENEATNFCNGYCKPEERPIDSLRNKPFYVPGWRDLEDKAIGVDGYHKTIKRHEYDVHNLYSIMQSKATAEYLIKTISKDKNARPYVLTRSNFPGIGKYAHHWMGDNWSTVEYMALSVDGVYSYNLFGLPFMGSDICGFNGDAAYDLCTKWHQLGSLYPFSRNHNQNASASQEPYRFNDQFIPGSTTTTYTDVIRTALRNRYSYIKYYYSAFHQIGQFGGSFFKPLFYEFQDDPNNYDDLSIKNNILLGEALKVSIQTQTLDFTKYPTTDFYFPAARWCQILPKIDKSQCWDTSDKDSKTQTLNSGLEDYYIHLRGGYIIPFQDAQALKINKTEDLQEQPTDLYVLPVSKDVEMKLPTQTYPASAIGYIYFDDGITNANIGRFDLVFNNNGDNTFTFNVKSTNFTRTADGLEHEKIGKITFLWVSKVEMDTLKNEASLITNEGKGTKVTLVAPTYDKDTDTLTVEVKDTDGKEYTFFDLPAITIQ